MRLRYHVCSGLAVLVAGLVFASPALAQKAPSNDEAKWNVTETLQLEAVLPEVEPNDSPATANAVSCGDIISPASLTIGDLDWFRFNATAGQLLTLGTDTDGGADVDTYIYLVDNTGATALAQDDDNGPGTFSLINNFPAPYTGVYYLVVEAFDPATQSGDYRAFVSCAAAPPPNDCGIANYKGDVQTFTTPVAIPDNNLAGILVGTIPTVNDGSRFLDVVVSLKMNHTWVGDLVATLTYDADCDGTPDASARFICRPGRAACDNTLGSPFGCSSNLSCTNTMYFSDAGNIVMGVAGAGCGTSSTVLGSACYVGGTNAEPLAVFDQFRKGGCFKLYVADHGSGDLGTVCEWGVWTLNEAAVPVEPTSWSKIKSLFR